MCCVNSIKNNKIAVCRGDKADVARTLGADRVIDYRTQDFLVACKDERFDVVFDCAASRSVLAVKNVLTDNGTYVHAGGGGWPGGLGSLLAVAFWMPFFALFSRKKLAIFVETPNGNDMQVIGKLAHEGKLTAIVDRSYPLSQLADAIAYVDSFCFGIGVN